MTGNTSALVKYSRKAILVEGSADLSTKPRPTFQVLRLDQVLGRPKPGAKASFSDRSTWRTVTDRTYGIKFAHPNEFTKSPEYMRSMMTPDFATNENATTISMLEMPAKVYPESNFGSGTFAVFVNPEISNAKSCRVFQYSELRFLSPYTAGSVLYTRMNTAAGVMGTIYKNEDFHTFQNGLCYEFAFRLADTQTGNIDAGCLNSVDHGSGDMKLIQPSLVVLSSAHFHRKEAAAESCAPCNSISSFIKEGRESESRTNYVFLVYAGRRLREVFLYV